MSVIDATEDEALEGGVSDEQAGGEPAAKKQADPPQAKVDETAIARAVAAELGKLSQNMGNTQAANQRKVDLVKEQLTKRGFDTASVEASSLIAQAMVEDQLKELQEKSKQDAGKTLAEESWTELEEQVRNYHKMIPQVAWAHKEIVARAADLMASGDEYKTARQRYETGKMPHRSDFEKAVDSVIEDFCKDNAISKPSVGLDTKNSKLQPKPTSKQSDPNQLSEHQRSIYYAVLNATKNKEKAMEAANRFR